MSFRKRRNDDDNSDCESDDERRIPVAGDEEDEDGPSASKKSRNLWSDMLLEEQLLEKGQSINLEKGQKKQSTFHRGPESYVMPADAFQKKKQEEAKLQAANGSSSSQSTTIPPPPVVVITPANDDPFGDAPIAPAENFGVKKYDREEQLAKDDGNRVGWWSSGPGHANRNNRIMAGRDRKESPRFAPKTSELLSEKYSLASFLACELDKEQMYDIDKLGVDIAHAMGEKDPATIKKIVTEIGVELSIKLFDETKEVERGGGMKTADGTRRRTPGGIFITLFKMDPNVTKEQKTRIFGDMRQVDKQKSRSRKRARDFGKKLEDVKKTMEEAAKPADVFDDEEVCEMV